MSRYLARLYPSSIALIIGTIDTGIMIACPVQTNTVMHHISSQNPVLIVGRWNRPTDHDENQNVNRFQGVKCSAQAVNGDKDVDTAHYGI